MCSDKGLTLEMSDSQIRLSGFFFIFIWKMKYSTCCERGTKESKSEFSTGIEPMASRTPGRHYPLSYKNSWWARPCNLQGLKFTIFLYLSPYRTLSTLAILAACKTRVKYEPSTWPSSPWVLVAQWIERPPGVWEVIELDSRRGLRYFIFRTSLPSLKFTIFIDSSLGL